MLKDDEVMASLILNIKKTHSERLLRDLDGLMKECGLGMEDVDGFAVSIGPGSFTGVRIGLACSKGLACSAGKPLVGVSTLKALALRAAQPGILICPVIDARRSEIFGAAFRFETEGVEPEEVLAGRAEPLEAFLNRLSEPALFCGDGSLRFRREIMEKAGRKARFAAANRNLPSALEVAILGKIRLLRGECDDPATLVPLYLRQHDARPPRNPGAQVPS